MKVLLSLVVLIATCTGLSGCGDAVGYSKRECARASVLELEIVKDRTNFPGESDPILQKAGSEAWTAVREWKEAVCEPTLLDAIRGISQDRGNRQ